MAHLEKPGQTLGADIRALRKTRGMTLVDLAESLNRSVGWLSQVERDISVPAISDLAEMAAVLDVAVSSLLQTSVAPDEDGLIVRANARRPIGSRTPGLTEGLLSPDLTDSFEVIHSKFEPGSEITAPLVRKTQEIGYIVTGTFEIWINGKHFHLKTGDSFRLRGESFRWANTGSKPCEIIWVISPPIY
ncbi:helix-turn-helix protein [Yoonia maritima]|uniref:Helix-turn-helix protein n=1 Tax=Yoonia maritima TaxID=1435347 RepID=A0A2T0VYL2_9RHOB|nr:cupin domain-containing protein [Yoonia maritima]PRY77318.1 helix-turn-helix protein [Yoonia maritima]